MEKENDVAKQDFWDNYWTQKGKFCYNPRELTFDSLFENYLPKDQTLKFLEIGCVPGRYLIYFGRKFGYEVSGVDYTPEAKKIPETLTRYNVKAGQIFQSDLFDFEPPHLYDVVASFGFVEHFENHTSVIHAHAQLVQPGGFLIITMPNFQWLMYAFRLWLDRDCLKKHVRTLMKRETLENAVKQEGFDVLYCNYYDLFSLWIEDNQPALWHRLSKSASIFLFRNVRRVMKFLGLSFLQHTAFFGTHTVCIAKKTLN